MEKRPDDSFYVEDASAETLFEFNYDDRFHSPKPKSRMTPVPGFTIDFAHKKPNWWWRTWQYLLLGWKWEDLKND